MGNTKFCKVKMNSPNKFWCTYFNDIYNVFSCNVIYYRLRALNVSIEFLVV